MAHASLSTYICSRPCRVYVPPCVVHAYCLTWQYGVGNGVADASTALPIEVHYWTAFYISQEKKIVELSCLFIKENILLSLKTQLYLHIYLESMAPYGVFFLHSEVVLLLCPCNNCLVNLLFVEQVCKCMTALYNNLQGAFIFGQMWDSAIEKLTALPSLAFQD